MITKVNNQGVIKGRINNDGGYMRLLTNKTGSNSVKGEIIKLSATVNFAFEQCPGDGLDPIGVVYESGIADGSECWIVTHGPAQVLLKNGTSSVNDGWLKVSDTAGRGDASTTSVPGAVVDHFRECGHCMEAVSGGTDLLAWCFLHFN